MMYHFMFGLAFAISPGTPVMFCSSISCCEPSDAAGLARAMMQHPLNNAIDSQVDHPEIEGKQKDGDDDHRGRCPHFLKTGEGHLPHFVANVREKTLGAFRELSQPAAQAPLVAYYRCCFCHSNPAFELLVFLSSKSGRGGGIRTPKSGFGDRQFSR